MCGDVHENIFTVLITSLERKASLKIIDKYDAVVVSECTHIGSPFILHNVSACAQYVIQSPS